jgi:protein-histidine pros-kinase
LATDNGVVPVHGRPQGPRDGSAGSPFEQFLEFVPDAIVGIGRDGRIVLVNGHAEQLFGYQRGRLIGKTIETLVPQRFRARHVGHRKAFFQEPRERPMGVGLELWAVRRDGTEFPVEVSLSHLDMHGETIAVAAVRTRGQCAICAVAKAD